MQRPHIVIGSVFIALALACASSMGSQPSLDPQTFATQRATIEQGLKQGGAYAEMEPDARDEVQAALERIGATFDRSGDVSKLSAEDKVQIFNDQELINSILTKAAADSRVVCERQVRRGSHIKTNKCMTVAERRRQAATTAETMRLMQNKGNVNAVPEGAGK